ncbi:hypothetical protein BJ742DRAFT_796092 [Cladochytrium replicatum]|nr:hypothetical protein BJ742DRAFT_796092 [Cladochytrium replicatum]
MPSQSEIVRLYRSLLRSSRLFSQYNYRQYVRRRSHDAFREHQFESDPATIETLYQNGVRELDIARRQGFISSSFKMPPLVVEQQVHAVRDH